MRGHIRKHRHRWQVIYELRPIVTIDEETGDRRVKRRQRAKSFDSHEAAEDFLAERINDVRNRGRRADAGRMTVADWFDEWFAMLEADVAAGELRTSTLAFYRGRANKHIIPAIGAVRLRDLDVDVVRELYASLAASVREKVHATLRPALADAVEDGKLGFNPTIQARRRRRGKASGAKKRRKWTAWSEADLNVFLDAVADDRYQALWRMYTMTGARRGELLALRWSDVEEASIRIARAFTQAGPQISLEGTKTGRERTVDLDDTTREELEVWRKRQITERLKAGSAWAGGDWVFTVEDGSPLVPDWVSRRFRELIRDLAVPRIRLHDLRHTHASLMLKAGVQVHVVAQRLGHSTPSTTLAFYAHVIGSQQRDAAALVDQALTRSARPTEGHVRNTTSEGEAARGIEPRYGDLQSPA